MFSECTRQKAAKSPQCAKIEWYSNLARNQNVWGFRTAQRNLSARCLGSTCPCFENLREPTREKLEGGGPDSPSDRFLFLKGGMEALHELRLIENAAGLKFQHQEMLCCSEILVCSRGVLLSSRTLPPLVTRLVLHMYRLKEYRLRYTCCTRPPICYTKVVIRAPLSQGKFGYFCCVRLRKKITSPNRS